MEERNDGEKLDEVLLPGFRFHPTDEELVGFYLKRKIQQRPLTIELIKQLDIYKYDPWDLPKLATTGEKEWYFYCPRDRKYRNSARPNRVTGAGFWKATGTDRPIYSSEGSKCIGLKKSLVFYKGRAAKGVKTDWMMHEFRLPTLTDSLSPKKFMDKTIPANESWAICRIFKKTNSTAQRALSHSWVSSLPEARTSEMLTKDQQNTQFCPSNLPLSKKTSSLANQFYTNNNDSQHLTSEYINTPCPLDLSSYKSIINNPLLYKAFDHFPISNGDLSNNLTFSSSSSQNETSNTNNVKSSTIDVSSMLLNMSSSMIGDFGKTCHEDSSSSATNFIGGLLPNGGYSMPFLKEMQVNYQYENNNNNSSLVKVPNVNVPRLDEQVGFAFGMPNNLNIGDAWKSNLLWDNTSSNCPCDVPSSTFSTTKCYT